MKIGAKIRLAAFIVTLIIMETCVSPVPRMMDMAIKLVNMTGVNKDIILRYCTPESIPENEGDGVRFPSMSFSRMILKINGAPKYHISPITADMIKPAISV
jgi:hypothetical protein